MLQQQLQMQELQMQMQLQACTHEVHEQMQQQQ